MKAQFRSRLILVFRHQPAIRVSWASPQVVLLAAGALHHAFPLKNAIQFLIELAIFHSGTALPHLLSHLKAIQIP